MAKPFMQIEVSGIRDLQKGLRQLGEKELPKAVQRANAKVGKKIAADVRAKAAEYSKTGRMAGSVGQRSTKTSVTIRGGGPAVPYWKFIDFGGSVGRGHHKGGGGAVKRDFKRDGRIMYPTVRKDRPEVLKDYAAELEAAIQAAGFRGRGIH